MATPKRKVMAGDSYGVAHIRALVDYYDIPVVVMTYEDYEEELKDQEEEVKDYKQLVSEAEDSLDHDYKWLEKAKKWLKQAEERLEALKEEHGKEN